MHPNFRARMKNRQGGESVRLRVDAKMKADLATILNTEGGSLTELLVEGVWRVVEERRKDPEEQTVCWRLTQSRFEAINFRISAEEAAALEPLAKTEACPARHLVAEGIWRITENRRHDPQYQAGRLRILALQAEIDAVRANLHSPPFPKPRIDRSVQ